MVGGDVEYFLRRAPPVDIAHRFFSAHEAAALAERARCAFAPRHRSTRMPRWRFWQCQPTPDYVLALCAASDRGVAPMVAVRQLAPAEKEWEVELTWLKTSARLPRRE